MQVLNEASVLNFDINQQIAHVSTIIQNKKYFNNNVKIKSIIETILLKGQFMNYNRKINNLLFFNF